MTRTAPRRRARIARRGAVAALLAGAVALTGCAAIPTEGPVAEGSAEVPLPGQVVPLPASPRGNETPDEIVRGFLNAQVAGPTSPTEFAAAREYMAASARSEWDPLAQVVVMVGEPVLDVDQSTLEEGTTTVSGTVEVVATLDERGQYTEAAPGTQTSVAFGLVRDADGEWRVDSAPDGLLLPLPTFRNVFRDTRLYFPTPDRAYWVPDERWFPVRNWQTYAVREVLAGPPEWLAGAVTSVVPEGTSLSIQAVPIDDGVATVELTSQIQEASREDRALLTAQLEETLVEEIAVERVRSVRLVESGSPLNVAEDVPLPRMATAGGPAVVVTDEQVMQVENRTLVPLPDVSPLTGLDPTALAVGADLEPVVVRDGDSRVVRVATPAADAATLLEGDDLVAPSVDRFGAVWSGSQGEGLLVVLPDGEVTDVDAEWLGGRSVLSMRVSHDGARVAILSSGSPGLAIQVAGVVRDEAQVPVRLTDPRTVGATVEDATQVVWVDATQLAVLGETASDDVPTVLAVPVGGQSRTLSAVEGAVSLAAGQGESSLLLGTADGSLYGRPPSSVLWSRIALDFDGGVTLPTYPG